MLPLAHGHGLPVNLCQHFYIRAHANDDRRADKNRRNWVGSQLGNAQAGFKTVHLPSKGVAAHRGVEYAQTGWSEFSISRHSRIKPAQLP